MSLTALQRQQRLNRVGASSVASILGENPYQSAYDLWAEITGKVVHGDDNEAAAIGNALEPAILSLAGDRLGCKVVRPTGTFQHESLPLGANVDGMVEKAQRGKPIVEAKSTGVAEGWGEAGTDEVPNRVLLQVQAQFMCSGSDLAYVARLFGRFGFKFDLYEVRPHTGLQQIIAEKVGEFWRCVETDTPPEHSLISPETARLIRRVPSKVIHGDHAHASAMRSLANARKDRLDAEKEEKAIESVVKTMLGDAEVLEAEGWTYEAKTIKRKGYVVKDSEYTRFTLKEATE